MTKKIEYVVEANGRFFRYETPINGHWAWTDVLNATVTTSIDEAFSMLKYAMGTLGTQTPGPNLPHLSTLQIVTVPVSHEDTLRAQAEKAVKMLAESDNELSGELIDYIKKSYLNK